MIRVCTALLLALALASGPLMAEDVIYKCRSPSGENVFSDKPCGAAKDMQQINIAPAPLPDITDTAPLCGSENGAQLDLAGLDQRVLASMSAAQRAGVKEALADYARSGSRPGARYARTGNDVVHLCLPTYANEIVEYVVTPDGKLIQMRGGMLSYRNDPDTPQALLQRCAETWNQCMAVPDAKPDSCVSQLPTCPASEPWKGGRNCCPLTCKTAYNQRRADGVAGNTAFMSALYDTPSCIPGIK